jgi:hypothetical protein
MNNETSKTIYDELSRTLTDYECGESDGSDLYEILTKIQSRWEDTITNGGETK